MLQSPKAEELPAIWEVLKHIQREDKSEGQITTLLLGQLKILYVQEALSFFF